MKAEDVLKIVLREMQAYGAGWRADWSDFDGRSLRNQLRNLAEWADGASNTEMQTTPIALEYVDGTNFYNEQTT